MNDSETAPEPGLEPQPAATPSPEATDSPSWRPADHYASPPGKAKFPRWVPISCGVAALFALVVMFAVGIFLKNGGLSSFIALAIGQFQGEMSQMIADDVPAETRKELDDVLKDVRKRLTSRELEQSAVLPLLQEIQKAGGDRKISLTEVEKLLSLARELNGESATEAQPGDI